MHLSMSGVRLVHVHLGFSCVCSSLVGVVYEDQSEIAPPKTNMTLENPFGFSNVMLVFRGVILSKHSAKSLIYSSLTFLELREFASSGVHLLLLT